MDGGACWATVHGAAELDVLEPLNTFTFWKQYYQIPGYPGKVDPVCVVELSVE